MWRYLTYVHPTHYQLDLDLHEKCGAISEVAATTVSLSYNATPEPLYLPLRTRAGTLGTLAPHPAGRLRKSPGYVPGAMRAACRKQQQRQSRQPPNTSSGSTTTTATACLVTLLSGGRGSMALSLSAYSSRSRALHPSAVAGVAPALAARASSSLNKRSYHERRPSSSVVAVVAARSGDDRHRRGFWGVSMSSVAGWSRGRQQQQPWMVGVGGDAGGGFFLGGRGGRPVGVGHR